MCVLNFQALLGCVVYLALLGIASQLVGMAIPRSAFDGDGFWFRCRRFEKEGRIYEGLGIRRWKDKLPDMSKLFKKSMVAKQIRGGFTEESAVKLVKETCVAELVHLCLMVLGFPCLFLWHGVGGAVVWALYALGNLPFVLIQRYNRPRLKRFLQSSKIRKQGSTII